MGVKVEGVRADERVVVADTTARNRKMLIGGAIFVVIVVVAAIVVVQALKPVPTYGPAGHQFQVAFGGGAAQSGNAPQVGSFRAATGVTGVESWRYANSSISEAVLIENFPPNDPFLIEGADATNLLIQELPGSHAVTMSGLPGVDLVSTTSYSSGFTSNFPYTDQAVLLQGDTQFVITAAGNSQSAVTSFVNSFKTVG